MNSKRSNIFKPLFEISIRESGGVPFKKRIMAALPDAGVAGLYLFTFMKYFSLPQSFITGVEGIMIVEVAVMLFMPAFIYILFRSEEAGMRATTTLKIISGLINILSILFLLALVAELLWMTSKPEGRSWLPWQILFLATSRVFVFLITRDGRARAMRFVVSTTARLVAGAFAGVFTGFTCYIFVALVVTPQVSWGMGWLIIGYTYFSAMALFQIDKPSILAVFADQDIATPEKMDRLQVIYPRFEGGRDDQKN
jgi:hypothetical protein